MLLRRITYLAVLAGCIVFFIAYGEWLGFMLLAAALSLPWVSLLISLGAISRFRASPSGEASVPMHSEVELWLLGSCPLPMPPFRGALILHDCITGEQRRCRSAAMLDTRHCGGFAVSVGRAVVCDYLGLFALKVRHKEQITIRVQPRPVPFAYPSLRRFSARLWRPRPGGGFGENHELRLYRPGDSLNQLHWKLTAKTGKLILRETVIPVRERMLVTLDHRGSREEMDRKLGKLLYLGQILTRRQLPFQLHALTGEGLLLFEIDGMDALRTAIDRLLCTRAAQSGSLRERPMAASWRCHIEGAGHES